MGLPAERSSRDELIATIRAVHAGERWLDPDLTTSLVERMGRADLTVRELEVLAEIARGASNRMIGVRLGISEGTVKTVVLEMAPPLKLLSFRNTFWCLRAIPNHGSCDAVVRALCSSVDMPVPHCRD